MKLATLFLLFCLTFINFSCKTDTSEREVINNSTEDGGKTTILPKKEYEEEIQVIFQDNKPNTSVENKLLTAVNLCNEKQTDLKNYMVPACNSKFFDVFPLVSQSTIEENFLVLCRSGVHGFPVRRILVYVKENGQYVVANTLVADLIGMEKSKTSEYKDLIVQFMDLDENRFECRYKWREGRYTYDKVMKINGNRIKAQYLDSMKVEIGREIGRLKLSY